MHALLEVKDVTKSYFENGKEFKVLDLVRFDLAERDLVCVVGPSGCGKSTLLRIIVGLDKPTSGAVLFECEPIRPDNPQVAMVFQSFALFPWLTVQQNVELGLEAKGTPPEERHRLARKFIDAVGLTGFEDAFPRELSGGMKQRVGIARALAIEPLLLCMDEPFSSLDPLTAQNLRDEILQLLANPDLPPKAVLMVTHAIDEVGGDADVVTTSQEFDMELDRLGPILRAAEFLGLATGEDGDVRITDLSRKLQHANVRERKPIIRDIIYDVPVFHLITDMA